MKKKLTFNKEFKETISRCLSLIDRNPGSSTYGCVDRSFWHNNDGKGFSIDSMQVVMLGISACYYNSGNLEFFKISKSVYEWTVKKITKNNYSEEYFPGQESYCSMSYNLFAMAVSSVFFKEKYDEKIANLIKRYIKLNPVESLNQKVAIFCANLIYNKDFDFLFYKKNLKNDLLEKGGIDTSYLSKTLLTLGWTIIVLSMNKQKIPTQIIELIEQILSCLEYFILNKKIDIRLNYRGNYHFLISPLFFFKKNGFKINNNVLKLIKSSRHYDKKINERIADDKYFSFFHFNEKVFDYFYKNKKILIKNKFSKRTHFYKTNLLDFKINYLKHKQMSIFINEFLIIQKNFFKNYQVSGFPIFKKNGDNYFFKLKKIKKYQFNKNNFEIELIGYFIRLFNPTINKSLLFRCTLKFLCYFKIIRKLINGIIMKKMNFTGSNEENIHLLINTKENKFYKEGKQLEVDLIKNYHYSDGHASRFYSL
jgi:hypothetical protein